MFLDEVVKKMMSAFEKQCAMVRKRKEKAEVATAQ